MTDDNRSIEIAGRFEANFDSYDGHADVQRQIACDLAEMLLVQTPESGFEDVVELGCGTGLLTNELCDRFPFRHLHLYDLVGSLASRFSGKSRVSFTVADLNTLSSLPRNNLTASGSCLQWIGNKARLFGVVHNALADGGIFAAATFRQGNLGEIAACGGNPLDCPSSEEWLGLLRRGGFDILEWREKESQLEFDTPLDVLRHLKRTGVLIPMEERTSTVWRFMRRYGNRRAESGKHPLTYKTILWTARKV